MRLKPENYYNTDIVVGKIKRKSGFYDDEETFEEIDVVKGDVQPYNGGRSLEEFGISEDVNCRIFCEMTDLFETDRIAIIGDVKYTIVYVEKWDKFTMVLLRKRND